MTEPRAQGIRQWLERGIRRLLLRFYPADFRRRFEHDWLRFLVHQRREERYGSRGLGVVRFWKDVIVDVAVSGLQLRWAWVPLARIGSLTPGSGPADGAGSRPPSTGGTKGRTPLIDTLLKDLRYSVRTLRKDPAFTAVVVLSLGLGIGATSTIFSAMSPVLLRPLPFPDSDRLVDIWETSAEQPDGRIVPQSTLLEWREHSTVVEQLETAVGWAVERTYPGIDGAERNDVQPVSRGLFRLLGVEPILGRHFVAEDADVGSARTSGQDSVIISYGFWQRRFGGDPDILGQTWGNQVVVGVMPAGFQLFPWILADAWAPHDEFYDGYYELVVGRLNPGVSMEQAQVELDGIARRLDQPEVSADSGWRVRVEPLHEYSAGQYRRDLYLLMGAAVLLLLIACSNVASLLVGRATNRHREFTTRAALGAGRLRLMRQMFTESVVLALLGGALGVLVAQVGTRLFVILVPTAGWYPVAEIRVDGMVLGFTLGLSLLTVVLFGMVPALRASKPDLAVSLKQGGRGSSGGSRPLVHKLLVGSQIALTFVLLAGAALMINSLVRLAAFDRGFDPERLLVAQITLESERYVIRKPELEATGVFTDWMRSVVLSPEVDVFYRGVLERLRTVPGVEAAEMATRGGVRAFVLRPDDPRLDADGRWVEWASEDRSKGLSTMFRFTSPGFYAVMGARLLRGRSFTERDTESSPWVAVINESLARQFFPDEDPIGGILYTGQDKPREIVGIVSDIRQTYLQNIRYPATIYAPHTQHLAEYAPGAARRYLSKQLILKTSVNPTSLAADLRRIVADVDPGVYVSDIETMQAQLDRTVTTERFWMRTLGIFATLALVLATVGIYGVISYAVAQRTHEIGVRMALGAQRTDVLKMVIRQGMVLTAGGLIVGVLGAVAATRLLSSWLYEIEATDPATFAIVAAALIGIALLATYVPARGATRVDPVNAMRSE